VNKVDEDGSGWAGSSRAGPRAGPGRAGPGRVGLGWVGPGWAGLGWVGLGRTGMKNGPVQTSVQGQRVKGQGRIINDYQWSKYPDLKGKLESPNPKEVAEVLNL